MSDAAWKQNMAAAAGQPTSAAAAAAVAAPNSLWPYAQPASSASATSTATPHPQRSQAHGQQQHHHGRQSQHHHAQHVQHQQHQQHQHHRQPHVPYRAQQGQAHQHHPRGPWVQRGAAPGTQQQHQPHHHQQHRHHAPQQRSQQWHPRGGSSHHHGQPQHHQHHHHQHHAPRGRSPHARRDSFRSYPRQWVQAEPTAETFTAAGSHRTPIDLKLVCYNVLCGAYIESEYFPRTPAWLLKDHVRRDTILRQLTSGSSSSGSTSSRPGSGGSAHALGGADLVALQEVDSFADAWAPRMHAAGFDGAMKERTATAGARADGSALFWRRDRFELVDKLDIEYCILPCAPADRKDNVGLGVLLRVKEPASSSSSSASAAAAQPPRYLALVNTHLLYNPKRGDLKIGQMQILMNSVDAWLNEFSRRDLEAQRAAARRQAASHGSSVAAAAAEVPLTPPHIALMMCGDFNAMPASTLMQLALEGEFDLDSPAALASPGQQAALQQMQQHQRGRGHRGSRGGPVFAPGVNRHHVDGQEAHDAARAMQAGMAELAAAATQSEATASSAASAASAASSAAAAGSASSEHTPASIRKRRHDEAIDLTADDDDDASDTETAPAASSSAAAAGSAATTRLNFEQGNDEDDDDVQVIEPTMQQLAARASAAADASMQQEADDRSFPSSPWAQLSTPPQQRSSSSRPTTMFPEAFFLPNKNQPQQQNDQEQLPMSEQPTPSPNEHGFRGNGRGGRHSFSPSGFSPNGSGGRNARTPDVLQAFYPFNEHDEPRRIGHNLRLRSVFVDREAYDMRQRIKSGSGAAASNSGALVRTDPVTGLPLRFRPTSHHHRFSGQVDHILFAPEGFLFRPTGWLRNGRTPESVCRARIAEQEARRRAVLEGIVVDHSAAAAGGANTEGSTVAQAVAALGPVAPLARGPALRVTSIYELPPLTAFQPSEHVRYTQVAQRVPQPQQQLAVAPSYVQVTQHQQSLQLSQSVSGDAFSLTASSSSSTALLPFPALASIPAPAPLAPAVVYVTQAVVTKQRDPGLPVPDSPSDHFPLAITFLLLSPILRAHPLCVPPLLSCIPAPLAMQLSDPVIESFPGASVAKLNVCVPKSDMRTAYPAGVRELRAALAAAQIADPSAVSTAAAASSSSDSAALPAAVPLIAYFPRGGPGGPSSPGMFDVDLCLPVASGLAVDLGGRVEVANLPPVVEVARAEMQGSYEHLPAAWERLHAWVAAQGRERAGPLIWEQYLRAPGAGAGAENDPAKWVTQLNQPLKPRQEA